MIRTIKVMLLLNNKQRTKLFECTGTARFAYNWALGYEKANYEAGNSFLSHYELRKIFTELKSQSEYAWLNDYSNNITKQAIKDACRAYQNFFSKALQDFRNLRAEESQNQHFMLILPKSSLLLLM